MKKSLVLSLAVVTLASGCTQINNEGVGTLAGGVAGGLLGSTIGGGSGRVAAAAGGALIGAFLGGKIGQSMDKTDRLQMQQALETAQTGKSVRWSNPDNGNQYTVRPTRTYYHNQQPCREYTTYANIGGKRQQIYGKACRMSDGSWKVIS